ncbi:type IX secretion system membrane protein, PorP/SprF family [Ekhidna lutea]|uniref:Type IX secretion system membrane protein, PorP/SprF family n=1 Tax=Ekhidna lutea TaxID=447679 RepID=A0A239FA62_EKHLU|nr:type IX secretion system membrane protein PorP/SprF [Ekhidna lutea]SNS53789.1 type IX secretion system membrane protein, PorP/SprF family [Ekhidna lutea]
MKSCLQVSLVFLLMVVAQFSFAQNEFFFNHYMFNPSYYNPAWVGSEDQAFAAAHHRTQWAGYDASYDPEGAPTTQLLSLVIPVQGQFSGFGLSVSNDKTGPLNSVQARISASLKKEFRFGQLSLGVMPALNVASINANYRFVDQGDVLIPSGSESQFQPNLHAGLYFKSNRDYFVGASVENLLQPGFDFGTDAKNIIPTNYLLMGGTTFGLMRDLILNPTILIRSDLKTYTYDISAVAVYQERMWGGLAFRRGESLSLLLGYSFMENNRLKAGYSFDYVVKDQDAKQPTSHEVFIRYDLPDLIFGGRKAVKTPRFTF